jgi:putative chitinase
MKISDIISEDIEEGWGSNLAKIGAGAAMAMGGQGLAPSNVTHTHKAPVEIKQQSPAKVLQTLAVKSGIKGNELAALMSQASHETLNFTQMSEKGSKQYFQKKYENPRMAKILGNTDIAGKVIPGSGEKFRGRGPLQITGKYNYSKIGDALGLPLADKPELLDNPEIGAKAALWYWKHRVAPKVGDFGDIKQVTKQINPGMAGLKSREKHLKKYHDDAKKLEKLPPQEKGRSP